ncbi:MAG: NUDIX domain-containing protein [Actinobacteria bacterium]|nr:MAG: NUDIX domain-containing protein [Actinomycetota bacterium]
MCAVGAIVLEKGEVLLVRRNHAPAMGQWSLPGGRVEWGETLREAVAREVREETGVEIDVEGLAGIAERIVPDDEGKVEYHYVIRPDRVRADGRAVRVPARPRRARRPPPARHVTVSWTSPRWICHPYMPYVHRMTKPRRGRAWPDGRLST